MDAARGSSDLLQVSVNIFGEAKRLWYHCVAYCIRCLNDILILVPLNSIFILRVLCMCMSPMFASPSLWCSYSFCHFKSSITLLFVPFYPRFSAMFKMLWNCFLCVTKWQSEQFAYPVLECSTICVLLDCMVNYYCDIDCSRFSLNTYFQSLCF